ncbi:phospholipase D family protein [Izhakiella australiensis]|uniref:phospholipase D n=1 Tax=Izhakiella australiensis TaxID=1926881 RepID=A0A1S8Y6P5_9GAMM|nr:phospholipase D family protein [Izhakiella australiensis]OON34710.1 phospholipase D family protein [Izhakiella australiensis]
MQKRCLPLLVSGLILLCPLAGLSAPGVSVGFSPEGTAQTLVLNTLDAATQEIRLAGYSFTAPDIVQALVRAQARGVDVKVVLDDRGNRSKTSRAAMNLLVSHGIPVRTNGQYAILHDKIIITDGRTVETGSFNYTRSAEKRNSENALVIRDMPELAARVPDLVFTRRPPVHK